MSGGYGESSGATGCVTLLAHNNAEVADETIGFSELSEIPLSEVCGEVGGRISMFNSVVLVCSEPPLCV